MPAGEAEEIAATLVDADLQGIASHGVLRVPDYVRRLESGRMRPETHLTVARETAATALVDGGGGWGATVARRCMHLAVDKALRSGVAWVAARNSNHFGTAGRWAKLAADEGLIGLCCCNAPPTVVPFGSRQPSLGTNPIAVAVPLAAEDPLVLDMASTPVARGRIVLAARAGEPIPPGWAIDADGQPTTDPRAALVGALLPIAGPKGSGLALIVDVLCGVLTGGSFGPDVAGVEGHEGCGQCFAALDVAAFTDPPDFAGRMARRVRQVRESPPAPGIDRPRTPGEPESERRRERRLHGIPVATDLAAELSTLAPGFPQACPSGA